MRCHKRKEKYLDNNLKHLTTERALKPFGLSKIGERIILFLDTQPNKTSSEDILKLNFSNSDELSKALLETREKNLIVIVKLGVYTLTKKGYFEVAKRIWKEKTGGTFDLKFVKISFQRACVMDEFNDLIKNSEPNDNGFKINQSELYHKINKWKLENQDKD